MPAMRPEDVDYMLADAFNARDLAAATELYEPDASVRRLERDGGTVATGAKGIEEVMAGYVGLDPQMEIVVHHVTRAGDVALLRSQWRITGTDGAGDPIELAHNGVEVVRRQTGGEWRFVIDHPYGADRQFEVATIPARDSA
ncbi:MAG: YybH family protein [Solirubrobacteraceae bacterium]